MCQVNQKVRQRKRSFDVFKVVMPGRGGVFISQYSSDKRENIAGFWDNCGKVLGYPFYKIVRSPGGPGIMAYVDKDDAHLARMSSAGAVVLRLRVMPRAKLRYGENRSSRIVCASRVRVVGVAT